MRVRHARYFVSKAPISARNARRSWNERRFVHLVVQTDGGAVGLGEAAPLEGYSRETFDACVGDLARAAASLAGTSIGLNVRPDLARALSRLRPRTAAATFAIESALLDALGKEEGLPVWRLVRSAPRRPAPVQVSGLVTAQDAEAAADEAMKAAQRGISSLKIKVGPRLEKDAARIAAVRAATPRSILRLDANQSCTPAAFVKAAKQLVSLGIELVEEPVRAWSALAPSPIPLAMDESLLSRGWQSRARRRADIAALVLKPMAVGGFLRCLRIAAFAERRGLRVYVTHLFDGPVAAAATAELALALPVPPLPCGLDTHGRAKSWPAHRLHRLGRAAVIPGTEPGLGVEMDGAAFR